MFNNIHWILFTSGKQKLELNSEVEILTEDGTEVDEDIFGELPSSTIFVIKNKVPTPDHEDTTDEGIQTIQEGILTNLFLLVTMY